MAGMFDDLVPTQSQAVATPPQAAGPITVDNGRGITVTLGGVDPAPAAQDAPPSPAPAPSAGGLFGDLVPQAAAPAGPSGGMLGQIADDAGAGFMRPLQAFGHEVMERQRASLQAPTDLADAVRRMIPDPTILGAPGAIGSAMTGLVTRPIAGQVAKVLPTPYSAPSLALDGGKLSLTAPKAMDRTDAAQGIIDTSLSGARPVLPAGVPFGPRINLPPAPALQELEAAKNAAYGRVDASGFTFPQADVQQLAQDITAEVARKAGPTKGKLYPASEAMADRLTALANQPGGVPLTQLDELRSDIWGALVKPGDREAPMGAMMRDKIDALMDASQVPHIREARDLNTRYEKVRAVTDKLDSADLRASSTYSGGNHDNATRQSLRPLVDPTSAQQIRNLTPDETSALRAAVTGTPTQNALRYANKILRNKFLQAGIAWPTHGAGPAAMELIGSVLHKAGEKQTGKAVQAVLDLMATGGTRSAPLGAAALPPVPPVRALSGQGLAGIDVLTLPLRPTPSAEESARRSANTKVSAPQRRQ